MTHYSHIPLVRILIPFLGGIILFTSIEFFVPLQVLAAIFASILILAFLISQFLQGDFNYRFAYGFNIMLFFTVAGYALAQGHYEKRQPAHFSKYQWEDSMLRLRIIEPVAEKTNSYQLVARITHIIHPDSALEVRGKLITWLEKEDRAGYLRYGDIIWIENQCQPVREPQNPTSFNYKKFLGRQNIYHQTYRAAGQWYFGGENEGNLIIATAHKMRQKALETLESNNIKERDFAVASALLLGYRDYLDENLRREFAGAGAMHILCVSGLHVGIIFLALNLIFGFLARLPRGRIIKTIVIILLIWFYAAITGFSPSVMRASTMFSFVAAGQAFQRSTNIYNTLAASALILVVMDPFIVNRIGFQLSYIAVISIVTLQPLFYKRLYFKNPILDKSWGILTVSMAAQLGTGPLSLFYFNQFPNYFLLTNLIVIPLTSIILKAGLLLFFTTPLAWVSQFVGTILSKILWVLHSSVKFIEGLPGSTTMNVFITFNEKLFILGVIAFAGLFFLVKQKRYFYLALLPAFLLSLSVSARSWNNHIQRSFVVYHMPSGTAIDFFHGNKCYFYACENTLNNPSNLTFNTKDYRLRSGAAPNNIKLLNQNQEQQEKQPVFHYNGFLLAEDHSFKIVEDSIPEENLFGDTLDFVIVRNNPPFSVKELTDAFPARQIIFDSSNSFWKSREMKDQCDSLELNCWSVTQQGAFVYDLQKKRRDDPARFF